jgi:hypothetical protein
MQNFDEYKKTLEDFIQKIKFFYSGDVIKSEEKTFIIRLNHSSISTQSIIEVWNNIYQISFDKMITQSEEIVIHRSNYTNIYDVIDKLNFTPSIMFFSKNSIGNLDLGPYFNEDLNIKEEGFFPDYFFRRFSIISNGLDINSYQSPLIEDSVDDCSFYLVDSAIQSSVWILQNMTYVINRGFSSNEHVIKYPVYDCNFKSIKIRVINTQVLREEKINKILDDN